MQLKNFPALRYYIGIYNGKPAATGTLFSGSKTTGIYDIAVAEEYRKRSIGSAMFTHLLRESATFRHECVVLQASPEGLGIYQKAGFFTAGNVHVFENRSLL